MNLLHLTTDNIQPKTINGNVNLYTTTTGNIISGAATTNIFSLNAKSIQLSATTTTNAGNVAINGSAAINGNATINGSATINGNVVLTGNITVGSNTNIINITNIQGVNNSDLINLYSSATSSINIGSSSSTVNVNGKLYVNSSGSGINGYDQFRTSPTAPYTYMNTGQMGYFTGSVNNWYIDVSGNPFFYGSNFTFGATTTINPTLTINGAISGGGSNYLQFGIANGAGAYSTSAVAGDVVMRSNTGNMLIQTGGGSSAIKIDSSQNVIMSKMLTLNSSTTDNFRAGGGTGYIYINNVGQIGYWTGSTTTWSISNAGNANFYGTLYVAGITSIDSTIRCNTSTLGNTNNGMIECYYASNDRYGICQSTGGVTRVYTSGSYLPSQISLCLHNGTGFTELFVVDHSGNARYYGSFGASDYRIKTDFQPIANCFDNLKPTYYYNKQLKRRQYGFIAHEVQEYYPDLVDGKKDDIKEDGEPKLQAIDYNGLIAILTKEIQDMHKFYSKQNEEFSNEIKEIKKTYSKQNEDLLNKIDDLKQRIVVLENQ